MRPSVTLLLVASLLATIAPAQAEILDYGINRYQLGGQYDSSGQNLVFKIYSSAATRVELYLYAQAYGATEKKRLLLQPDDNQIWSVSIPVKQLKQWGISGAVYYGYRAWGPNWPYQDGWQPGSAQGFVSDVDAAGNRFNPNKLLFDPYAREISHDPLTPQNTDGTIYASGPSYRTLDSGSKAAKGIVWQPKAVNTGSKPQRQWKDDVVYEVQVRGFTQNDATIPAALRGTYKGAARKAAYLKSLGVTAVEFLPVQETQNDTNNLQPNSTAGSNYWGYMTLNYFAPDRRYSFDKSPGGPTREFKAMVKAFHDQGIKVLIDVVYNHTGEGGAWGSGTDTYNIFSFRGLDNPTYYSLTADKQHSWDNTGVGGNYNTFNPIAQNLIIDSLAYWANTMGVDGFRYDLASVLGNTCQHGCYNFDKMNANTALNRIVRELPPTTNTGANGVQHIAEPWAIGGNSYQVGGFPSGWSEWNGRYRDTLRQSQNKLGVASVTTGQLATRIAGSSDLFQNNGRQPWNSVNFMVAHDGFTLSDVYRCNDKNNNQAWPYGPSDGGEDQNNSWDQGGNAAQQRQAARNGMSLMLLSAGVPMMTGGDEMLRSLQCNNNPYNLDSIANWLSYNSNSQQQQFTRFVQGLLQFRATHPALRPTSWYSPLDNNQNGMAQLSWYTPAGTFADADYFGSGNNHALAWRIDGSELNDPASALYIAYNGWSDAVNFNLPDAGVNKRWYRVTDSCSWAEGDNQVAQPGKESLLGAQGYAYSLCGRGVLLLLAR